MAPNDLGTESAMVRPDDVIVVTGAAGFLGRDVVIRLLHDGWRVRATVRAPGKAPPDQHARLQVVCADMRDGESLADAIRGATAVVHLAAAKADERDSDDVNVGGAHRLVAACRAGGCRRLINVSTQSVKIRRKGIYARTKSEADEVFRSSGLNVTILLPSIIYGDDCGGVFGAIVKSIRALPIVPVLGDGRWVSAPVYIADVSDAIVACLHSDRTIGRDYDIGGPDLIAFDELIDRIGSQIGMPRRKVHVPFEASLLAARLLAILPNPPVTVSNVLGSNQATDIDIAAARRDFGYDPLSLSAGFTRVFGQVHELDSLGGQQMAAAPVDDELAHDCRLIAWHLLGRETPPEVAKRYCEAWRHFYSSSQIAVDPEWRRVRRHPWTLGFVDAAAAVLRIDSPTRKQVLIVTALLETTSTNSDFFLKPRRGLALSIAELVWQGLRCVAKTTVGIPLLIWSRRS